MQQTAVIRWNECTSTFIKRFKYEAGIITIEFCDGGLIEYYPDMVFPPDEPKNLSDIFAGLIDSESVGKYWHKHIKNKLEYKRLK